MEKGKKLWAALVSYKYVLLILLAGLALLLWPERGEKAEPSPPVPVREESIQKEMERILAAIDGVGNVQLMLTLETDGEKKLAGDSSLRYSGATAAPDDYERQSETVILSRSGTGQEVVVIQETQPKFRGALVVCDGGDIPSVRLAVIEAVSALTGLGTDKIAVVKSKGETA